jgi:hypothetical protein
MKAAIFFTVPRRSPLHIFVFEEQDVGFVSLVPEGEVVGEERAQRSQTAYHLVTEFFKGNLEVVEHLAVVIERDAHVFGVSTGVDDSGFDLVEFCGEERQRKVAFDVSW